jgi:Trk K+ transport system NAD-binding subunit
VFLVIAGTVVGAGLVAWPLASGLRLRLPSRDRVAILGAQGLGMALASELQARGAAVVLIDTDPQRCHAAERLGLSVVFGDGLSERTLRRARIELVGTVVGATFNDHLNSQFVAYAREAFDVPVGLVSVGDSHIDGTPPHVVRHGADMLFDQPHDQERWDVRWRQREIAVVPFEHVSVHETPPPASTPLNSRSDAYVLLTIQRNQRSQPMARSTKARPGDRAAVAIYSRAEDHAVSELAQLGWQPVRADGPT